MNTEIPQIPTSMDKFNFSVLALLKRLYEIFPVPSQHFRPGNVCLGLMPHGTSNDEVRSLDEIAYWTFQWIRRAGFVDGKAAGAGAFTDVVLTLKGLVILESAAGYGFGGIPPTFIEKIQEILPDSPDFLDYKLLEVLALGAIREMASSEAPSENISN